MGKDHAIGNDSYKINLPTLQYHERSHDSCKINLHIFKNHE